ncbi:hypothetical protein EV702DRAFT_1122689 [Suillus placidus]|uniref:Uncharacterized protein n=1 Tax=Suillus placidus TaxID=48579 RepID=A0A9P7D0Q6_9AGAM|nr:hypothetical protein EV702DRAFT_1122689 [Suillus placidus]
MSVSPQISVRIAIAITVLKHKPKDQSIPSYLLDLQSHFLSDDSQATCDEDAWRNHALSLEKELESLKQKREEDEEELFRLRQNVTKDMPDDSDAAPTKKKTKKAGKAQELQLQDDDWPAKREERLNATGQSSPSLTAALTSLRSVLNSVSSQTGDDPPRNSRLLAAITRTIDTIGRFLGLQNIPTSPVPSELNESRIAMASQLLVYVLRVAFPALFYQDISHSSSIAVSRLISTLFVPVVRSFTLISRAYIMHHLDTSLAKKTSKSRKGNEKVPKPPSQTLVPDARMDLLTLLSEALNTLDSISPRYSGYTAGIREHIALESIRALELLYSTGTTVGADGIMDSNATPEETSRGPESSQASHPHRRGTVLSRKDRLEALARKDATWYLCHILNSCVSTGGPKDELGSMLNGALFDGTARIVKMCISMDCDNVARVGRRCVMDVMCRNMVLAACEKIISALPQENTGL